MDREDVRAFLDRDWRRLELSKSEYWAERKRRLGCAEGVLAAEAMRLHAIALHPEWPTVEDRAADLAAHLELAQRMTDVGPIRSR